MTSDPSIILVSPQMGENIGAAARVMANFGLKDLRLVAPRDGWPNPAADTMSAGAFDWGVSVQVFETVEQAVADLSFVLATTARPRGMVKPVFNADTGVAELQKRAGECGVLFGAERSGLPNEAVALSDAILTYPVDTSFSSLNLAQAVGVFAHAWGVGGDELNAQASDQFGDMAPPAKREDFDRMLAHFEDELERAGFFFPPEKKSVMMQNLTNALVRANWTQQEVQTFRGAIKALALGRGKARITRDD